MNYFFLGFTASTSTPTCVSLSSLCNNWNNHQLLDIILILDNPKYMWRQPLEISQEIHIHSINNNIKKWLGFFLLYLRQNIKPYTLNEPGLSWKILQKKICTSFDRSSLILDQSSQADLHSKSCNNSIPTLYKKHILWASLNKTKMFWSWFANITKWISNTLVPNSLEPNKLPLGNPWQNTN